MRTRLALFVLAVLLPGLALAQVPGTLGYQGRLLKADGTPASGVVKLTFRLFDKETQGSELWSETQQVGLTDGFYATFLGSVTPLPATALDAPDRFLQVDVEGEALLPRQRVGSVAFALKAGVAQSVSGGKVDASSLTVAGKTVIDSSGNLDSSISGAFAPKAHTHDAADVASGTLALGRIPQGPGSKLDADTLDGVDSKDLTKKADLSTAGTINDANNPVDWTKLKNVPPSLAGVTGLSSVSHDGTLSGDGTSGNPLQVSIGTTAGTVAAGDHTHSQYALDSSLTSLKQALGAQGTVNDNGNPVSWTQVKDIPAGIADGVDDAGLSSISVAQPLSGDGTSSGPITMSQASAASSGFLSSGDWATFNSRLASVAVSSPLVGDGTSASPLSLTKASGSTDGYLSATDYAVFNAKLGTVTASTPLSGSGTPGSPLALSKSSGSTDGYLAATDFAAFNGKLSSVAASAPLTGSGTASSPLALPRATTSANGYLGSSDFAAFNNKLDTVAASAPLSGNGTGTSPLTMAKATSSANGYLSSTDWAAFNGKLSSVSASGPLTGAGTATSPLALAKATSAADGYLAAADFAAFNGKLDTVAASAPLSGNGTGASPLTMAKATSTANGYLSSADWAAFNGKLSSVSASGPLTGNGTSTSPLALAKATGSADGYLAAADFSSFSGKLSSVSASGPLTGNGTSSSPLALAKATGTADGYLAAADFSSFSGKLSSVSVSAPLTGSGTASSPITLGAASGSTSGYLSASDWNTFNGKVGSVGAGTGVSIGGTATAPTVSVVYGTTSGTAAAGNDPRLSDARAPAAGSANYIQNQSASPQAGTFNISGAGLVGSLTASGRVNAAGYGIADTRNTTTSPSSYSSEVQLNFRGGTVTGLPTNYAAVLGVAPWIDDSGGGNHELAFNGDGRAWLRYGTRASGWGGWRTVLDSGNDLTTSGNLHANGTGSSSIGGSLSVAGTVSATGGVASAGFQVQRDVLQFNTGASGNTPIHIKTSMKLGPTAQYIMYRLIVEGYNYGVAQPVFSDCVGYANPPSNGDWTSTTCRDYAPGATLTQYRSSDGFVVLKLTNPSSFYYLGINVSAQFLNPTGTAYRGTYTAVQQAADL